VKDQKTLSDICARIQGDYSFIDPEMLQIAFRDLEGKQKELASRWSFFKTENSNNRE
jgi:hypothetical protein